MGLEHFITPPGSVTPQPVVSPELVFDLGNFHRRLERLDWDITHVMGSYLRTSSDISTNQAAHAIEDVRSRSQNQDHSIFMGTFFEIVLHFAGQIPPNHEVQKRLVDLVDACSLLPYGNREWYELWGVASGELASAWRTPVFPSESTFVQGQAKPTSTEIARWLNLNSFLASLWHVTRERQSPPYPDEETFTFYATVALRSALEGFSSFTGVPRREEDRKTDGALDCDMAVAAEWIEKACKEIFEHCPEDRSSGEPASDLLRASGGLYMGHQGIDHAHFVYWASRFREFGLVTPGVSEKSKALALKSYTTMKPFLEMI